MRKAKLKRRGTKTEVLGHNVHSDIDYNTKNRQLQDYICTY